jgi:hypothetical protein
MKMDAVGFSKPLVPVNQTTRNHIPQHSNTERFICKFLRIVSQSRTLTPLGTLLFDKLIVTQVVIKFTVFYETRRLTTVFTTGPGSSPEPGESRLQPHNPHLYDTF